MSTYVKSIVVNNEPVDQAQGIPAATSLPAPGTVGRLQFYQADNNGLYLDTGAEWVDVSGHVYNVQSFGADPTGNASSSTAFQNAINAAIQNGGGTVVIPAPPANGFYKIDKTIFIQPIPLSNFSATVHLRGSTRGDDPFVRWYGPNNTSIFVLSGLFRCLFENISVWNITNAQNLVFWDVRPNFQDHSCTVLVWRHCYCEFGNPGGNNIAWRVGQSDPSEAYSDNSDFHWVDCDAIGSSGIYGSAPQYGDIAWQIGGANSEPMYLENSGVSGCYIRYLGGALQTQLTSTVATTDTTIDVISTEGFPSAGVLQLSTNEIVTYTGTTATTFTGLTRGLNGTTPTAFGGAGYVIYQFHTDTPLYTLTTANVAVADTTIYVQSTSGFPSSGTLMMTPFTQAGGTPAEAITYTGTTPTSFTGCSRGALGSTANSYGTNYLVMQYQNGPSMGVLSSAGTMTSIACSSSTGSLQFFIPGGGRYTILGDRCENGMRFLQSGGGLSAFGGLIEVLGCEIVAAQPSDNVIFYLYNTPALHIESTYITYNSSSQWASSSMITTNCGGPYGSISLVDCEISLNPGILPINLQNAQYGDYCPVVFERVAIQNASGLLNGWLPGSGVITSLTDAASVNIPAVDQATYQLVMTGTGGVGANRTLTISNAYQPGMKFRVFLQQPGSGGPCTVTWFSGIRWQGGLIPSLSTTPNAIDRIEFETSSAGVYLATPYLNYH